MSTSTKQIENFKSFENELHVVEKIQSWNKYRIELIGHETIPARLSKKKKTLKLEIDARLIENDNTIGKFSFTADHVLYKIERIDCTSSSAAVSRDFPASFSRTYKVRNFQAEGFNDHGLFKTFCPVDLDNINTFHYEFETVTYQSEKHHPLYDCLRINLNGIEYDITQFKTKDHGFYMIENRIEEPLENYLQACFSIKQAIGFINNLMPGDEEYIFDSSGKLHYSNFIRPTLKGIYRPISSNPYSFLDVERRIANTFQDKLTRISLNEFSNLISKIHNNSDFSIAILVILEVTTSRSLLLIPSSFSSIIELLSKAIGINEIGLEFPIDDKELEKKIVEELHKVIDNNSNSLNEESILKLKRRLIAINSPINKQHLKNIEKLTRPFEQLGIRLTLDDINIMEHRNDLLHGNILLKKDDIQTDEEINLYIEYVSAKLYTLISKLILKSIGYNGYIYNHAKHLEKYLNNPTEEDYFERI